MAPNLTTFSQQAATFENHYAGSLPCMPSRREVWTGTEEFWWRGWGPLEPWDQPIAYLTSQEGITSQLITDHYHLCEWGSHSYNYDYTGYTTIRGHEADNWRTDPVSEIPDWAQRMVERRGELARVYLRNVQDFARADDFFGPQVMQAAIDWLDRNKNLSQFFMHIDCFDVHEPFHVPEPYRSLYTDADYSSYNPWPLYGRVDSGASALALDEVEWVRAQYAGKITMMDAWLGRLLDRLRQYRLLDRTCVIITTDHGHYLGDHGWMGKPPAPVYRTLCHIPLIVWHPKGAHNGKRVKAITQTVDLYATVLELLGLTVPTSDQIHSRNLLPVIEGKTDRHRNYAISAYNCQSLAIATEQWTLLRDHDPAAAPAYWYSHQVEQLSGAGHFHRKVRPFEYPDLEAGRYISGVQTPVWRMPAQGHWACKITTPREDMLFHIPTDPDQTQNVANAHLEVVRQLEELLRAHARAVKAPEEQLRRLGL